MHEMSLINDLMAKIVRISNDNGSSRIRQVRVSIGALAHISAEHFREHFDEAAAGTPAEGAKLEIEMQTDIHDPRAQDILLKSVDLEELSKEVVT